MLKGIDYYLLTPSFVFLSVIHSCNRDRQTLYLFFNPYMYSSNVSYNHSLYKVHLPGRSGIIQADDYIFNSLHFSLISMHNLQ